MEIRLYQPSTAKKVYEGELLGLKNIIEIKTDDGTAMGLIGRKQPWSGESRF